MGEKTYRHELKHHINVSDMLELSSRLRRVAYPDPNAGADGTYLVRSLYFDNYKDKAVTDKLSGQSRREKFRIRYYNGDTSFIRLEKKSKINRRCLKESIALTPEQCQSILDGNLSDVLPADTPLLWELHAKMQFQHLRARAIVDYVREAFIFPAGNVRITIDSDIRTSNNVSGFLTASLPTIPCANEIILEAKYDGFLPDLIGDMVQLRDRRETEFSKYVVARLI